MKFFLSLTLLVALSVDSFAAEVHLCHGEQSSPTYKGEPIYLFLRTFTHYGKLMAEVTTTRDFYAKAAARTFVLESSIEQGRASFGSSMVYVGKSGLEISVDPDNRYLPDYLDFRIGKTQFHAAIQCSY